jgi:hypothetical protein
MVVSYYICVYRINEYQTLADTRSLPLPKINWIVAYLKFKIAEKMWWNKYCKDIWFLMNLGHSKYNKLIKFLQQIRKILSQIQWN